MFKKQYKEYSEKIVEGDKMLEIMKRKGIFRNRRQIKDLEFMITCWIERLDDIRSEMEEEEA